MKNEGRRLLAQTKPAKDAQSPCPERRVFVSTLPDVRLVHKRSIRLIKVEIVDTTWRQFLPEPFRAAIAAPRPLSSHRVPSHLEVLDELNDPPIGIAGLTPRSDTLEIAGERGFMPMSLNMSSAYLAQHWASVERGAAKTNRTANREKWRVVKEVYVAETDAEAKRLALQGMLARAYREYLLPLFRDFGLLSLFKHDQSVADSDVTPEYLVEHSWLVGSPRTVRQKLDDMYGAAGGFGTMLVLTFDFSEEHEEWAASQQMLISEVLRSPSRATNATRVPAAS